MFGLIFCSVSVDKVWISIWKILFGLRFYDVACSPNHTFFLGKLDLRNDAMTDVIL